MKSNNNCDLIGNDVPKIIFFNWVIYNIKIGITFNLFQITRVG